MRKRKRTKNAQEDSVLRRRAAADRHCRIRLSERYDVKGPVKQDAIIGGIRRFLKSGLPVDHEQYEVKGSFKQTVSRTAFRIRDKISGQYFVVVYTKTTHTLLTFLPVDAWEDLEEKAMS